MPLSGSGFQLYLLGSRSLAMGQVGTGAPLDASAIFFNPGAMGFEKAQIQFGGTFASPLTAYLEANPGIELAYSEPTYLSPIYFYGLFKANESSPVSFGISVNSPFGNAIRWPRDWKGRFISQENRRNSLFIQPTVSLRLGSKWGIGGGLVIAQTTLYSRNAIDTISVPPTGVDPTVSLSSRGTGIGFNLGLYYRPNSELSLGLNYRSAVNFGLVEGVLSFEVPPSVSSQFPDVPFTSPTKFPSVLSLGIGYRPQPGVLFCFDINYTHWSIFDTLRLTLGEELGQVENIRSIPNYRSTFSYRLGAEISLSSRMELMLGTYYDISPVLDGFVSPEFPDANRLGTTAGVSVQISDKLSGEMAILFETTGERTVTFVEKGFDGTYQTNTGAVSLGIKYALSDR